ncbi:PREDICTED: aluminum-activated malate transporter 2-like [Fragaria vesca subsp. vesca]|uniref:aluminum-activated malate transporter 2-like n=1 Tax=Fragaria vesca subsp. vesca TaxID=101020 RepID=UPI0002C336EB|nr:PREDICTED: aluminum-activated malate transporter 2-like [Fragaria vesca subsp. vesca]
MTSADFDGSENGSCGGGPFGRLLRWLKAVQVMWWGKVVEAAREAKKLGEDDPRRIVHSFKVGLALTLVSLFYYYRPLYDGFGVNAMWAVLTVVVVFEFSVGATLGKGINRMLATLLAGALAVGVHHISTLWGGEVGEPILIAFFVFVVAASVTFMRFFPALKARYDYGLIIFILTFCLVSVSGYRETEVLDMAHKRLSTIAIGSCTPIMVCLCICPVWIGVDLQNLVAGNMEKLGDFMEGFGFEYFDIKEDGLSLSDGKSFLQRYKSVLSSKTLEETMANLARWEPGHGGFKFFHPWEMYLNVGTQTRQCAYKIEALNTYLNTEIQAPAEIRIKIQDPCIHICTETGKALKELAAALKEMTLSSSADHDHIAHSKAAAESLKSLLKRGIWEDANLLETIPSVAVASLLIEVVACVEKIAEAVHELASVAHFKTTEQPQLLQQQPVLSEESHVAITIDHNSTEGMPENRSSDGNIY